MGDSQEDNRMDNVAMEPATDSNPSNGDDNRDSDIPIEDPNLSDLQQPEKMQQRFLAWIILLITNVICIIAICLGRRHDSAAEKWAISLVTLSFVGSLAAVLWYQFARAGFVSGPLELGLVRRSMSWLSLSARCPIELTRCTSLVTPNHLHSPSLCSCCGVPAWPSL